MRLPHPHPLVASVSFVCASILWCVSPLLSILQWQEKPTKLHPHGAPAGTWSHGEAVVGFIASLFYIFSSVAWTLEWYHRREEVRKVVSHARVSNSRHCLSNLSLQAIDVVAFASGALLECASATVDLICLTCDVASSTLDTIAIHCWLVSGMAALLLAKRMMIASSGSLTHKRAWLIAAAALFTIGIAFYATACYTRSIMGGPGELHALYFDVAGATTFTLSGLVEIHNELLIKRAPAHEAQYRRTLDQAKSSEPDSSSLLNYGLI